MEKVIEVEYPDWQLKRRLEDFIDKNMINEDGSMKEGVYGSHIIINWIPNS